MFALEGIAHNYDGQAALVLPHFEGQQGDHWLVLGLSGSGKTTLLHIMAGLLRPTHGRVAVAEQDLGALTSQGLDRFRGQHVGIIFQKMHLLQSLTVAENLRLAQHLARMPQRMERVEEVLAALDLSDKTGAYPQMLSLGEQQRVSIARAVINNPQIILADEPTSALDDLRSAQVLDLLLEQAEAYGATLVIATHDHRVKARISQQLMLDQP